jgi:purine-binding chemotaxis protein CheW
MRLPDRDHGPAQRALPDERNIMQTIDKSPAGSTPAAALALERQYLSFRLGGLEYGLDFAKVQELRPFNALERFASEGEIINGVAVSRGVIMPIVDMRIAFGSVPAAQSSSATDVIILKLSNSVMGMVVDGVTDIVTLSHDSIRPIPGANASEDVDYLLGLGQIDGRRLILIDIDRLMSIRSVSVSARAA